jgi:hypothetical protein
MRTACRASEGPDQMNNLTLWGGLHLRIRPHQEPAGWKIALQSNADIGREGWRLVPSAYHWFYDAPANV